MLLFGTPHNFRRVKRVTKSAVFENWTIVVGAKLVGETRSPLDYLSNGPLNSDGLDMVVALCVAHHKGIYCTVYEHHGNGICDMYRFGPDAGTPEYILVNHTMTGEVTVEMLYEDSDPLVPFRDEMDNWSLACEEISDKLDTQEDTSVEPTGLILARSIWGEDSSSSGTESPINVSEESVLLSTTTKGALSEDEPSDSSSSKMSYYEPEEDPISDAWEMSDLFPVIKMTEGEPEVKVTTNGKREEDEREADFTCEGAASEPEPFPEDVDTKEGVRSVDYGKLGTALSNLPMSMKRKVKLAKALSKINKQPKTSDLWLPHYPALALNTGDDEPMIDATEITTDTVVEVTYADVVKRGARGKSSEGSGSGSSFVSAKPPPTEESSSKTAGEGAGKKKATLEGLEDYVWDPVEHEKRFGTKEKTSSYVKTKKSGSESNVSTKSTEKRKKEKGEEKATSSKPGTSMFTSKKTEEEERERKGKKEREGEKSSPKGSPGQRKRRESATAEHKHSSFSRSPRPVHAEGSGMGQKRTKGLKTVSNKSAKKLIRDTRWSRLLQENRDQEFWERYTYAVEQNIEMTESEMIMLALNNQGWLTEETAPEEEGILATTESKASDKSIGKRIGTGVAMDVQSDISGHEQSSSKEEALDEEQEYDSSESSSGLPATIRQKPKPYVLQGIGKKGLRRGQIQNSDEDYGENSDEETREGDTVVKKYRRKSLKTRRERIRTGASAIRPTDPMKNGSEVHGQPKDEESTTAVQTASKDHGKELSTLQAITARVEESSTDEEHSSDKDKGKGRKVRRKRKQHKKDDKSGVPLGKKTTEKPRKDERLRTTEGSKSDIDASDLEGSNMPKREAKGIKSDAQSSSEIDPIGAIKSAKKAYSKKSKKSDTKDGSSKDLMVSYATMSEQKSPHKRIKETEQKQEGSTPRSEEVSISSDLTTTRAITSVTRVASSVKVASEKEDLQSRRSDRSGAIFVPTDIPAMTMGDKEGEREAKISVNVNSIIRTLERMIGTVLVVGQKTDATINKPILIRSLAESGSRHRRLVDYITSVLIDQEKGELDLLIRYGMVFSDDLMETLDIGSFVQVMGQKHFPVEMIQYVTKEPFLITLYSFLIIGICRILNSQNDDRMHMLFSQLLKNIQNISEETLEILKDFTFNVDKNYMSVQDVENIFQILYAEKFAHIRKVWNVLSGRKKVGLDLTNLHVLKLDQFIEKLEETNLSKKFDGKLEAVTPREDAISLKEDLRILFILVTECENIYKQIYQEDGEYKTDLTTYEIRELKVAGLNLLEEYFKRWHVADRFNYINPDMWEASIRALTTHASRISSFRRAEMTKENNVIFMDIMVRLYKLLGLSEIMPMAEVCKNLEDEFESLMLLLPEPADQEVKYLMQGLLYCENYTQAWQYALRIKGIAYEALFALEYNLQYVPELQKPNLSEIIRNSFPMHYKDFIELSAKKPIVRSLVPDFYSHRKSIFGDEVPTRVKAYLERERLEFVREEKRTGNEAVASSVTKMQPSVGGDLSEPSDSYETAPEDNNGQKEVMTSGDVSQKPSIYHVTPSGLSSSKKKHAKPRHTTDTERQKCVRLIKKGRRQGKVFLGFELLADSTLEAKASPKEVDDAPIPDESITQADTAAQGISRVASTPSSVKAPTKIEVKGDGVSRVGTYKKELIEDNTNMTDESTYEIPKTETDPMKAEEELVIYEVGYVTDAESKMSIDVGKWAAANNVLNEIGLQTTLIFAIDSSMRPKKDWWISSLSSRALKKSVGKLFRQLIRYTPIGIREKVIGNITTLKYQRMRGSGHTVRTSTTLESVKTCYSKHKDKIQLRPTGTVIPKEIMDDFENSLINGCAISPKGAEDIMQLLKGSSKLLIQIFKNTDEAEVLLENEETRNIVLFNWMKQEIENSFCKSCYKTKMQYSKEPTANSLKYMASILRESVNVSDCCKKNISTKKCLGPVPLYLLKCPNLLEVVHPLVNKEDLGQVTELDQIMGTAFPGRTQPQKKFKRAVDKLCRIALDLNGISAIKNSKGQILLNTTFSSQISKLVSVPNKKVKPKTIEKVKEQLKTLIESFDEMLHTKEIESYSEFHKNLVLRLIDNIEKQHESRCSLSGTWVSRIFKSLELTESAAETIVIYNKTIKDRRDNADKNDSFRPPTDEMLKEYFNYFTRSGLLTFNRCNLFNLDCVIFQELMNELVRRCAKTAYNMNIQAIGDTCKLLLKFSWFQSLVFYSKLCGTYLTACSEFTGSGVKLLRIAHTPFNLAIKLPSNKKNNSKCSILDLDMDQILPSFILNRAIASLGHAMPFVILVILIQTIQNYRCIDGLTEIEDNDTEHIESMLRNQFDNFKDVINSAHLGNYKKSTDILISLMPSRRHYMSYSTKDRLIRVIINFTIGTGIALVPAMLLNSLNFNSQIQKMRFTVLMGLSMIGRPADMGRKMYASSRRVESYVARCYLQVVSHTCLTDISGNIHGWKEQSLFPEVTMPSISLFGVATSGDRHCLTDIYLVHAFNKELDNFDEGSIAVLEELADRHFSWERHITKVVSQLNKQTSKRSQEGLLSELRNLMGVINLKAPEDLTMKERSELQLGKSSESTSSRSARSDRKLWDARSRGRESVISISSTLEAFSDVEQEGQYAIREKDQCAIYHPVKKRIMKECKRLLKLNPSYTMGIGEVLQAMVEFSKTKFPEVVICQAKRDPKNWASIASVSESTAIVPGPLRKFDIQLCMESTKRMECTKLKKLLKNRLTYLGGAEEKIKNVKSVAKELEDLLSCLDVVDESVKEAVSKGISMARQLRQVTWEQASEMQLHHTVLTSDGHNIYYWIKNLKNAIEKFWKTEKAAKLYNNPLNLKVVEVVKCISKGEKPIMTPVQLVENAGGMIAIWIKVFDELINRLKLIKQGEEVKFESDFTKVLNDYTHMYSQYKYILEQKRLNPDLSYQKLETNLSFLESQFLEDYSKVLGKYLNFMFCACLCCPWSRGFRYQESVYLKNILTTIGLKLGDSGGLEEYVSAILPTMGVRQFLTTYFVQKFEKPALHHTLDTFFRYNIALYSSNSKPMSYVYNKTIDSTIMASHSLIQGVQDVIARSSMQGYDYDFAFTIKIIAYGSHAVAQKLTGKSKRERLPRSVRSKVIYEIIKLMGTSGSAILQEIAFEKILDVGHQFFATLAPKAQLGGNRDLFVQETGTKLIHATTEIFAKTLLSQTSDDGLTNSKLKEEILNKSLQQFKISAKHHGVIIPKGPNEEGEQLINFYKVMTVAGDNTKWGPIHCCSFFSLMYQQLLLDHPDWKHYIMLVMLKDLYKEVEIPTASISKILNSLKHDEEFIKNYKLNTSHAELSKELLRISDSWSWKPLVQDLINNYLSKGVGCMRCYNHMGQGIHHATSSLLTSMLAEFIKEIVGKFVESELEGIHCTIIHAGSSDDYAKVIVTNGSLTEMKFEQTSRRWKHVMLDAKNLMSAVSRLVQVKDSSKTLSGTIVAEFYSEFVLYHRASPAGIKFIITSLINSSITSPITMSQACQVSSQQAFFNSVPHLTNLTFTLCRQQVYFNYVENFIRKYGAVTLGSLCSIGRLYIPKISNMLESGLVIEDIEQTVQSFKNLSINLKELPEEDFIVEPPGSVNSDSSSTEDRTEYTLDLDSSANSTAGQRTRVLNKALDAGIATEFEKHTIKSTEAKGVISAITRHQSNSYYMECDKIVNDIYKFNTCNHHSKIWHDQFITRFIRPQPDIVKSLCIPPSGSLDFDIVKVDGIEYSVTLIEVLMRDVLVAIMFSHYKKPDTLSFGKRLKASYDREESSFYEDPFIQIKPNSLEREMKNIREAHDMVKKIVTEGATALDLSSAVSSSLVKMNNMTEDHLGETERLMQAIRSRSIVWGLSGGLKELSVPMYSIFINGFFFLDNAKICTEARWASSRREGHMDSSAREIGQRPRSKFTFWLDTALSGSLRSIERNYYGVLDSKACVTWFNTIVEERAFPDDVLSKGHTDRAEKLQDSSDKSDNDETKDNVPTESDPLSPTLLQRIIKGRKKVFLSLDTGLCEKYARELISLTLQFSNINRQKILSLETNQNLIVRPADYTTIVKTKLFSKGTVTQTNNNPAVVVAYKLSSDSVYSLKPAGVDYSNLCMDGLTIGEIHPAISEICLEIIGKTNDGTAFDEKEVHEYTRVLTSLCRLASSHRYSSMSFYALRPTESSEETNLVEVISYGLQEGKQVTFPTINSDMAAYSERFFVILEAIGCINQLPLMNEHKTTIMQNFLTWIPNENTLDVPESCAFINYKSSLIANFGDEPLAGVLLSEQHQSHSQNIVINCGYLSQYVMNPESLQSRIPYTGTKPTFLTEGSKNSQGNFRYYSPDGNAAGIFISGKLHIHIDKMSNLLVDNVCKHVLRWITGHNIRELTEEDIKQFLLLLPTCESADMHVQDKGTGELCYIQKTGTFHSAMEVIKGGKVGYPMLYYVENHMKTTFESKQEQQPIMCDWQPDKLLLYYQVIHDEVKPSESYSHSIEILLESGLENYKDVLKSDEGHSSQKIVIANIPLSAAVNFKSLALLHLYLTHMTGPRSYSLGIPSKEATLDKLSTDSAISQVSKYRKDFERYFKWKEETTSHGLGKKGNKVPNAAMERDIRNRLNQIAPKHTSMIDWVAVQSILKMLSLSNSTVIAEEYELRKHVKWKVVPSTLDTSLLTSEEGQLFRACMELDSLKVRPLFCRLSITESGCKKMVELSAHCKSVLQTEGLSVELLNSMLFCTVLYNKNMKRGENGIMTIEECLYGTLPMRQRIGRRSVLSCLIDDGNLNMSLMLEMTASERASSMTIARRLKELLGRSVTGPFNSAWRQMSSSLDDNTASKQPIQLMRHKLLPSSVITHITYTNFVNLLFPNYQGEKAMSLCCKIISTLLDNQLEDADCLILLDKYKDNDNMTGARHVSSGEMVRKVASGEDILNALDELEKMEGNPPAPAQMTEEEINQIELSEMIDMF